MWETLNLNHNNSNEVPFNLNVFYASGQLYTYEMAVMFHKHHNWNPAYWLVSDEINHFVKNKFPNTLVHRYIDSVKGKPADGLINEPLISVDPALLDKLSNNQITAFHMMNRNDSHTSSFSFAERSEFFRKVLNYWYIVTKKLKIELVVFEEEPHQASDYILYILCGAIGIRTLMVVRTISNLGLLPVEKFEVGCTSLIKKYNQVLNNFDQYDLKFEKSLELYFRKLNGDYETILAEHLWDQVESVKSLSGKLSYINKLLKVLKYLSYKLFDFKSHFKKFNFLLRINNYESDQKQKGIRLDESNQGYFELFYYRLKAAWRKKKNLQFYNSICSDKLDLEIPYIICGLQYQPEKSTCPLGGNFVDQIFMVELLSYCLPQGWKIYVKEHPSQFVSTYTRYGECRDRYFYSRLNNIKNVELVTLAYDSFSLIDKAHCVASVGGTICWEGVARGVPALSFADTWFAGCEGVFRIESIETLKDAFNEISGGYKPEKAKVMLFAKLIREIGFHGAVGGARNLVEAGLTPKENAKIYYKAFREHFENI